MRLSRKNIMNTIKVCNIIDKITTVAFYLLAASVVFSTALTEIATISIVLLWSNKKGSYKGLQSAGGRFKLYLTCLCYMEFTVIF